MNSHAVLRAILIMNPIYKLPDRTTEESWHNRVLWLNTLRFTQTKADRKLKQIPFQPIQSSLFRQKFNDYDLTKYVLLLSNLEIQLGKVKDYENMEWQNVQDVVLGTAGM